MLRLFIIFFPFIFIRDPERWEGEGGGRGDNTCKSMADSCQCMAKTTTVL